MPKTYKMRGGGAGGAVVASAGGGGARGRKYAPAPKHDTYGEEAPGGTRDPEFEKFIVREQSRFERVQDGLPVNVPVIMKTGPEAGQQRMINIAKRYQTIEPSTTEEWRARYEAHRNKQNGGTMADKQAKRREADKKAEEWQLQQYTADAHEETLPDRPDAGQTFRRSDKPQVKEVTVEEGTDGDGDGSAETSIHISDAKNMDEYSEAFKKLNGKEQLMTMLREAGVGGTEAWGKLDPGEKKARDTVMKIWSHNDPEAMLHRIGQYRGWVEKPKGKEGINEDLSSTSSKKPKGLISRNKNATTSTKSFSNKEPHDAIKDTGSGSDIEDEAERKAARRGALDKQPMPQSSDYKDLKEENKLHDAAKFGASEDKKAKNTLAETIANSRSLG